MYPLIDRLLWKCPQELFVQAYEEKSSKTTKNVLKFQPRESNYRNTNSQSMLKVMSIKSQDGSCCFVNKVRLLKGHQCRNAVLAVQ